MRRSTSPGPLQIQPRVHLTLCIGQHISQPLRQKAKLVQPAQQVNKLRDQLSGFFTSPRSALLLHRECLNLELLKPRNFRLNFSEFHGGILL